MNEPVRAAGLLSTLSHRAVGRVAAAAGHVDAQRLSGMLYAANAIRAGARIRRDLDARWIERLLLDATTPVEQFVHQRTAHWQVWTGRDLDPGRAAEARNLFVHKVYVSPRHTELAAVAAITAQLAAAHGAASFKIGGDADGILRADKIVVYFDNAAAADAAAARLDAALTGHTAQGIPFTGQVGDTGLVSRGQDQAGVSWRMLVCDLLGHALHACAGPETATVARNALQWAELAGLDTRTFWPSELRPLSAVA